MSSDQVRGQILSCLETVKLDLEELHAISSSIVIGQAIELIESDALKLEERDKEIEFLRPKYDEAAALVRRARDEKNEFRKATAEVVAENLALSSRLDAVRKVVEDMDRNVEPDVGCYAEELKTILVERQKS